MGKVFSWGKWFALLGMLSLLAVSMAFAAPVRAQRGKEKQTKLNLVVPAEATGAAALFGVDEGALLSYDDTAAALAAGSGAHWTRTEINWSTIEANRGTYVFTTPDAALSRLLAHGLNPVVYVSSNPTWASELPCAPIDTKDEQLLADFGNFMGATAAHYPDVKVWALYNEPDSPFGDEGATSKGCFGGDDINGNNRPDYADYAVMLKTAWKAVHAANPTALMATGALAFDNFSNFDNGYPSDYPGSPNPGGFNYKFPSNLFGYMGANPLSNGDKYIDMVLFNYYEVYGPYWETKAGGHGIQAKANVLRAKMQGASIPIVDMLVTETGEWSLNQWIGLQGQARCMNIIMVRGAAANLKGIVWWTFRDYPDSAAFPQNTWKYGMVDQDMQIKPSYTAMQVLVSELNNYTFIKPYSGKKGFVGVESYLFRSGKSKKYVVWSSSIKDQTYKPDCSWTRYNKVATFKAKSIRMVDYMGKPKTIQDNKKGDKNPTVGYIGIKVGGDPKIVQLNPQ